MDNGWKAAVNSLKELSRVKNSAMQRLQRGHFIYTVEEHVVN